MLSLGAMAQTINRQPPTLLIDNLSVDGENKNKFVSELNPKNAPLSKNILCNLLDPSLFAMIHVIQGRKIVNPMREFSK